MALQLVITNAGRAAIIDQANGGFRAVRIAAVGVSPTAISAAPASANLPGEVKRIGTIAGEAIATDVTHLTVTDESADSYTVRSFALYLSDGTLFALYGQADQIVQKSAQALLLLAIDVALSDIPAAAITFGNANFTNPAATTARAGVVALANDADEEAATDNRKALTSKALNRAIRRQTGLCPVDYEPNGGAMTIRGDAGGWVTNYAFKGFDGTWLGGLGAYGSGSTLNYLFIGAAYTSQTALRIYPNRIAWGDSTIWHATNDGSGSGLDADMVDGWHRDDLRDWNYLLNRPASIWHAGNDGAGSGLDADLLDGRDSSAFLIRNVGNLPLDYDASAGAMTIRGDGAGWVTSYAFRGFNGTWLGGLGAYGSGSALNYLFLGAVYNAPATLRVYADRVTWGDNIVWHAGNDGAGSGLDADLLDGRHASDFALVSGVDFTGPISARTPDGSTNGGIKLVASPASGAAYFQILDWTGNVQWGLFGFGASGLFRWNNHTVWHAGNDGAGSTLDADMVDGWHAVELRDWNNQVNRPASIWHAGNDGAGSTLDADMVDGWHAGELRDWNNQLNRPASIWHAGNDGSGSGLDADLLDGWHRDEIRDWGNILNKPGSFPATSHTHGAADIAGAFPGSLSGNGYTVLPNGLILQWVTGAQQGAGSEGSQYVMFPIAFPNACFQVFPSTQVANVNTESHATYQLINHSSEGATVMRQLVSSAGSDREPSWPHLFAIGR